MPAPRAVAVILETLRSLMIDSQEGVVGRIDEELLHDYRVAVRRTRSALTLFGAVMPPGMLRRSRRFFEDLGRRTNVARDLDVLLLELPGYAAGLPDGDAAGLASLSRELARQVAGEYAAIGRWLRGKTYRRALETWRGDVATLAGTPHGAPIDALATGAIREAAATAFNQAEKLEGNESDTAIHRMRIRFKRLRYALEFARGLSPGGEIESFIVALKALQDELGLYQDLVVHQGRIAGPVRRERANAELVRVGDRLVAELRHRQARLHGEIRSGVPDLVRGLRFELERVLESLASRG